MSGFDALPFQPEKYDGYISELCTNCFAYMVGDANLALVQTSVYPTPGVLAGMQPLSGTINTDVGHGSQAIVKYPGHNSDIASRWEAYASETITRLKADEIRFTGDELIKKPGGYPGALFIFAAPTFQSDFHCARINPDETFSQKYSDRPPELMRVDGKIATHFDRTSTLPGKAGEPYRFAGYVYVSRDLSCDIRDGDPSYGLRKAAEADQILHFSSENSIAARKLLDRMGPFREAVLKRTYAGKATVPVS